MKLIPVQVAAEVLNEGRRVLAVNHSFVESNVTSRLDDTSLKINVVGVAHRLLVAKENTRPSVDIELGITVGRRERVNAAPKNAEEAHVDATASAHMVMAASGRSPRGRQLEMKTKYRRA